MFLPALEHTRCCLTSGWLSVRLQIFLGLNKEHRLPVPKATLLTGNKNTKLVSSSELLLLGLLLEISPDYAHVTSEAGHL